MNAGDWDQENSEELNPPPLLFQIGHPAGPCYLAALLPSIFDLALFQLLSLLALSERTSSGLSWRLFRK